MSEEEIIYKFTEIVEEAREESWYEYYDTLRNTLDLIEKLQQELQAEKEKNKELLDGLKYRVNYCKLLEKELYENGVNYKIELTKIEQKYLQELLEE